MDVSPRQFFIELMGAMMPPDRDKLARMIHPECEAFFPQSGELTRGFEQFMAQLEHYPSGPPGADDIGEMDVLNEEERWAISPGYTVVPLANPTLFTIVGTSKYPDGLVWNIVMSIELRDGKIFRTETYFAPPLPAPILQTLLTGTAGKQ